MSLILDTGPTAEPITTAEAKLFARVTIATEDTLTDFLIIAAREYAETFTGRQFVTATWEQRLDAFPVEFVLPLPPLISVTSIKYIDTAGDEQTLDASYYTLDKYSTPGRVVQAINKSWPSTQDVPNAVIVKYTCGYGDAAAVPEGICTAIKQLVLHWFKNRDMLPEQRRDKKVPIHVDALLWQYRVIGMGV